MSTTTRSPSR